MSFNEIKQFDILHKIPLFYREIIISYNKCKKHLPLKNCSTYNILTQPLWGNINFMMKDKCFYFPEWIEDGILYVKDLINENGQYKSDEELYNMISNKRNIISQISLIKKICSNKI